MFIILDAEQRARELLPICPLTVGAGFLQPPCHRPEGAAFHQIYLIESGKGVFETPDGTYHLEAGAALFMRKNYPIRYYAESGEMYGGWVSFDGFGCDALFDYLNAGDLAIRNGENIRPLLQECCRLIESGVQAEVLAGKTYELILSFFSTREEGKGDAILEAAQNYIRAYCRQDISVGEIAKAVGVSESLLYRLFRRFGEGTPIAYLQRARVAKAKQLLAERPQMPVSEVAARCGFADTAYFCKVFRDREKMTPKTYRAMFSVSI